MDIGIKTPPRGGEIRAVTSKSAAHRLLIAAALADRETFVGCTDTSRDIEATARCLCALGADIRRQENGFRVRPVNPEHLPLSADCYCGESGSTLRFLLPVAAALGVECRFFPEGRLPQRPLSPLYELLQEQGIVMSGQGSVPFCVKGKLSAGRYTIAADVSSQFISGLLFALAFCRGKSEICLTGSFESRSYVDMTCRALSVFGVSAAFDGEKYMLNSGGYVSPGTVSAEGDWSNAAFWLAMGAIGREPVCVSGLDMDSLQGDRAILELLERFGAKVETDRQKGRAVVYPSALSGIAIDAGNIPDLVPILSLVGVCAQGETVISHAERLRIKECDRLFAVQQILSRMGADIRETADGLVMHRSVLRACPVDSFNDHRIVMTAAAASVVCGGEVTVRDALAVEKSYPAFWQDFEKMGGVICRKETGTAGKE